MALFKKSVVVGVSLTPERGLEVAQIDFATKSLLKYASAPVDYYNINTREINDLDSFRESLQSLLMRLDIPKGAELVISLPAGDFRVNEYSQMLDETQLTNSIEEELGEYYLFKDNDPGFSAAILPTSTEETKQVAYEAVSKGMLIEIALMVDDLGYKLKAIDTNVSTTMNALAYIDTERIERTNNETNWVLLVVDDVSCHVASMLGDVYLDVYEERISIGEILDDADNYSSVLMAVEPILMNLPSEYLYVVSKTNIISAEVLANKIEYGTPKPYKEANKYATEEFLNYAGVVDESVAKLISLDVIGAAIYDDMSKYMPVSFNLFNRSLGEVYTMHQPPEIVIGKYRIVLSDENLFKVFLALLLLAAIILMVLFALSSSKLKTLENQKNELQSQKAQLEPKINQYGYLLSDNFDEAKEIQNGLEHNKSIYSYYKIVGTEIPRKLWLTELRLGDKVGIEGQADNLESVYGFFRSIKDYNPDSDIKLQKLGLAASSNTEAFDTESILTSINADYYEFNISNEPEIIVDDATKNTKGEANNSLPELETIKDR